MSALKRRRKAILRRQWVRDMDVRHAVEQDRLPRDLAAASVCSCGRKSWLLTGASDEDHDSFLRENDDHTFYCTLGDAS